MCLRQKAIDTSPHLPQQKPVPLHSNPDLYNNWLHFFLIPSPAVLLHSNPCTHFMCTDGQADVPKLTLCFPAFAGMCYSTDMFSPVWRSAEEKKLSEIYPFKEWHWEGGWGRIEKESQTAMSHGTQLKSKHLLFPRLIFFPTAKAFQQPMAKKQ